MVLRAPAPRGFPIWGSIIDDIWAIEAVEKGYAAREGPVWLQRCDREWEAMGIESNAKKAEDGADTIEVQGVEVRGRKKTVGVSRPKRRLLFQAVWMLLGEERPIAKAVERVLRKLGFVQSGRACQRSCFHAVYGWLARTEAARARRQAWSPEVFHEFVIASWLIPVPV